MPAFQRVGLFMDPKHQEELAPRLSQWLQKRDVESVTLSWDNPNPSKTLDLVVAMGGDGTILSALHQFDNCPVLGVNYGNVGFLTAGNEEDIESILQSVLEGHYVISERSLLDCEYPGGSARVVNEVVVRGATRLISVDLIVNDMTIRQVRGDGVIVGTPTGSTAYLMSAGSPIVMPDVRCIVFSGLNEYKFTARHLIINHDADVRLAITPATREQDIYLSIDGQDKIPLAIDDEIRIRESKQRVRLVFLTSDYFFSNLSSRLSW